MREIKYKVWNGKDNRMETVIGIAWKAGQVHQIATKEFEEEYGQFMYYSTSFNNRFLTLVQYTGLRDKNGTEIYEGDILKGNNNPNDLAYVDLGEFGVANVETEGIVDKVIGWHTKVIPTDALSKLLPFCLDMPLTQFYIDRAKWEIIGNIYENPDLLEGANGE